MSSSGPSVPPAARRILVVDDDEGMRAGLVANLELEGYRVEEAHDGAQAIEMISQRSYDVILSDVVMPNATGVELLSALRRQRLETPFILVSGFVSEALVTRALDDGLFAMLYKPFAMERILKVVARAIQPNVVLMLTPLRSDAASVLSSLRAVGMRVEACEDSASAVSFARTHTVDVCVIDFSLQPEHGRQLCQALQDVNDRMDVIAITGSRNHQQILGLARRGVVTCLQEPFAVRDLLTAIARVRAATPVPSD